MKVFDYEYNTKEKAIIQADKDNIMTQNEYSKAIVVEVDLKIKE